MKRGGPLQRKTPLRTGKPLTTRTPLASSGSGLKRTALAPGVPPVRRTPVRAVSTRKRHEKDVRAALVTQLVAAGVRCEICPELAAHGIVVPGGCPGRIGGIHERRKRSASGTVDHAPNLIPCCNASNGWIETAGNDELRRLGVLSWLVVVEGDPEWQAFGRADNPEPEPVTVKLCPRCGDAYVTVPPSGLLACGHRAAAA